MYVTSCMKHNTIISHVAIIPDGNRRWAKEKNIPTIFGHERGYQRVRECLLLAKELGIPYVTIWAFSTENWKRESSEVNDLMDLFFKGLSILHDDAKKEGIKVVHIGRRDRISKKIVSLMEKIEEETKKYTMFTLCIAIDYGGEDEIQRASEKMIVNNTTSIYPFLDTSIMGLPKLDVVIRTGGEKRTSGFMPMQSLYAEWFFLEMLFPDFDSNVFKDVVQEYFLRCRRFGK